LELRSNDGTSQGSITVRLSICEPTQAGAIARANAREDLEHGGILGSAAAGYSGAVRITDAAVGVVQQPGDLENALGSIVSKLAVFIQIMDKTSQVSGRKL
jgi:hypothetical protein